MARLAKRPLRGGAGGLVALGHPQPSTSSGAGARLTTQGADLHPPRRWRGPCAAPERARGLGTGTQDGDDLHDDTRGLFGIDLGDQPVGTQQQPIDLDGDDMDGGVATSTNTRGTSTTVTGKLVSIVWQYFDEINDETGLRTGAICKHYRSCYTARSSGGTGHLRRHMKSYMEKQKHATMVQSKLALNPDGLKNWVYDPVVARS